MQINTNGIKSKPIILPAPNSCFYCNFSKWFKTFVHSFRLFEITFAFGGQSSTFAFVSLSRGMSTASLLSSSGVTPPNATLSQPIVISDTPSPAVSIITIHSDTDTEDERKFHPARWGRDTPLLVKLSLSNREPGLLRVPHPGPILHYHYIYSARGQMKNMARLPP